MPAHVLTEAQVRVMRAIERKDEYVAVQGRDLRVADRLRTRGLIRRMPPGHLPVWALTDPGHEALSEYRAKEASK